MNHTLGNENKENAQQIQPLIIRQILLICVQGNVWKTVWIICVLMLGFKWFIQVIVRKIWVWVFCGDLRCTKLYFQYKILLGL